NLARHHGLVLDLALLGETDEDRLLLRSGARAGDAVLVSGDLGGAAAGLALLLADGPVDVPEADAEEVLVRPRRPTPRLDVAGVPITIIGEVTDGPERVAVDANGGERRLAGGWQHFVPPANG